MRNLFILLCLVTVSAFAQNSKTINSPEIKEVKIYQGGAQVSRVIKASVNSGVTILNVEGLSANVDKNSISVTGSGDAVLLSVVHQLNYLNNEKKLAGQAKLEDTLETLQNLQVKADGLEGVYTEEQSLMKANKTVGGANVGLSLDNLQKVADFFRSRMIELNAKLMEIHKEQKNLKERINKVQQQMTELNATQSQPTSTIAISISAKAATSVSLDLSYYVTGAGWTPQYDVRCKDINSPIQFAYKANVFQKTGEQWDEVKLKLSTGNPSQNGVKPTLNSWFLDFYHAPVYKELSFDQNEKEKNLNIRGSREAGASYYVDGIKTRKEEVAAPLIDANSIVSVNENQLSTDFDIAIPYTVPSDGKQHAVDVQNFSLPAAYSYYAAPKIDKDAFLVARVTGWEELNLLPGKANIYFEGSYIGESLIDPRNTTDTLDLSLGRDKRIVITREKKKDLNSTKFLGANVEKELNYLITVRNTKKDKIVITLEDQLPLVRNTDITVKTHDTSEGVLNGETGKLTWKLDVGPSSSVEKRVSFSVKYPTGKTVTGL